MIYLLLILVVLLIFLPFVSRIMKSRRDLAEVREVVHNEKGNYVFLIDRKFHVKETNFYELNEDIDDNQPYVLGNVLRCQNACDSGLCGTGLGCNECPIRLIVKNGFKLKRNFGNISAKMHLYDGEHQIREVNVEASGQLKYIGYEPHFLISVSEANNVKTSISDERYEESL